ncbi:hypothetical protein KP509_27G005500 [Ceratopteris richardii]|uniref:Uncharacterized protein n=1 Tax=Ceratopteris richardii TaxID=49495 RepID=A0A8T2RFM3_CERRI|nr:hypothetical protein KP509_27G005500 [Ceratopteris richardii]
MEKKAKEKVRQEMARVRFFLNTDTYKNLLQDGFKLKLSKNQDMKMKESQNPLFYKDDSNPKELGWLVGTGKVECYTMHIDLKEVKINDHLDGKILGRGSHLEWTIIVEGGHRKEKAEALEVEPEDIWLGMKERNVQEWDERVEWKEVTGGEKVKLRVC